MDNNIIEFMKSEDQIEMMLMQMQMGYNDLEDINPAMIDHFMTSCTNHDNNINLNNNNSTNVQNNPHLKNNNTSNSSPHDDDDELMMNNVVHNIHPSIISFSQHDPQAEYSKRNNSMAAMREMIFRIAAMQPVHIDPESVKPTKRKNVRISSDPQSVAARHRRERISERIRILQRLVPGGTKMDTASMLDEAIHYVKFLKNQVQSLERVAATRPVGVGFPVPMASGSYFPVSASGYRQYSSTSDHNVQHLADA